MDDVEFELCAALPEKWLTPGKMSMVRTALALSGFLLGTGLVSAQAPAPYVNPTAGCFGGLRGFQGVGPPYFFYAPAPQPLRVPEILPWSNYPYDPYGPRFLPPVESGSYGPLTPPPPPGVPHSVP